MTTTDRFTASAAFFPKPSQTARIGLCGPLLVHTQTGVLTLSHLTAKLLVMNVIALISQKGGSGKTTFADRQRTGMCREHFDVRTGRGLRPAFSES